MMNFVGAIFLAALVLAGIYFFAMTPEAPPQGQPSPHALDQ
ncbi:succinate dehydrogenase hydrophobic anchor subunit [Rhizobium sp. BK377]|nr:succinate dehydrogenase hydrophobic anchor subunit [Rhizobium sp. BK377]